MADEKCWDVFLSYASPDRAEVEKIALRLDAEAHLNVFLDKWRLVPGERFIPGLQDAIRASRSCAVFIGKEGVRPWQHVEVEAALSAAVNRSREKGEQAFRIIPVLLPGAVRLPQDELPAFIGLQTWVDFGTEKGLDDPEAFTRLVSGIRGIEPGKPKAAPRWLTRIRVPNLERPTGVAVDGRTLYLADHATGNVLRIRDGDVLQSQTKLLKPHHLIVMGDVLVATDTHNHQLVFFDLDLNVYDRKTTFGDYRLRRPHGLSSNFPNEFYVTDADNHRVLLVRNDEVAEAIGRAGCSSGIDVGEFSVPCGVAASLDCVYVADTFNHRVQVLTRDLRFLSGFGAMGHGFGEFAYPVGVACWNEWILVADEHNKRLQLWRREGEGLPFSARCISADLCSGWLGSPFGLCFDEDGRLLVADRKDGQVLCIDFSAMLAELRSLSASVIS